MTDPFIVSTAPDAEVELTPELLQLRDGVFVEEGPVDLPPPSDEAETWAKELAEERERGIADLVQQGENE